MKVTIEVGTGETTPSGAHMTSMTQMASDPTTKPQLLSQIATQADWQLRQLVASNPNTPTETLWQLGIDFPEAILNNPIFELLQLEQLDLVTTIPHPTLTSLLQCDHVPTTFMEYAVSQQDYSLWLAVAYNPHTPGTLLANLAQKSRRQDRELILYWPKLSTSVRASLKSSPKIPRHRSPYSHKSCASIPTLMILLLPPSWHSTRS
jgi:hypothetical protein